MSTQWWMQPVQRLDSAVAADAARRQETLTKPPGSLGELETLAIRLAGLQRRSRPAVERITIAVFAGDHGVAANGVSAFPQAVTTEMVRNFARGGAAISVLARQLGAALEVINLGTVGDTSAVAGVTNIGLGAGTTDFTAAPAMTAEQLDAALDAGRAAVGDADLFIGGEMGIGNTTAAAAVACALLQLPPSRLAGPGTGLDGEGVRRKAEIISRGLARHDIGPDAPLDALRCLGGFEIAALVGAYLAAGQRGVPVLVDGFISSVAALVAVRLRPELAPWLIYAHRSAEPGHALVLEALDAEPLLDLGMRLGEGSGAAVAVSLLRQACALHNEMATFAEAAVSR